MYEFDKGSLKSQHHITWNTLDTGEKSMLKESEGGEGEGRKGERKRERDREMKRERE